MRIKRSAEKNFLPILKKQNESTVFFDIWIKYRKTVDSEKAQSNSKNKKISS